MEKSNVMKTKKPSKKMIQELMKKISQKVHIVNEAKIKKCYVDPILNCKVHVYNGGDRICQCKELSCEKEPLQVRNGWQRDDVERKEADKKIQKRAKAAGKKYYSKP
jgi:hypothetical protein